MACKKREHFIKHQKDSENVNLHLNTTPEMKMKRGNRMMKTKLDQHQAIRFLNYRSVLIYLFHYFVSIQPTKRHPLLQM